MLLKLEKRKLAVHFGNRPKSKNEHFSEKIIGWLYRKKYSLTRCLRLRLVNEAI
jgi:hypothetical protein